MRRLLTALICLLLPARVKPPLLRLLGHRVANSARIAPSLVWVNRLALGPKSRIGPGNLISVRRVLLRERAYIGYGNLILGPLCLAFAPIGAIGNRNVVLRTRAPSLALGPVLWLGEGSKITAGHHIDLTRTIRFGAWSTLAGKGSQIWTHGYVHLSQGSGRSRVDGRVWIGDNVYIGAGSVVGPGVTIVDRVSIGSLSSVAADLLEPGLWVSQKLRHIALTPEERIDRLPIISPPEEREQVRWKGPHRPDRA
jgi:acetyltransferase-like isoleucine patch superfamily enzyme